MLDNRTGTLTIKVLEIAPFSLVALGPIDHCCSEIITNLFTTAHPLQPR
jgi:hypothetical protein